MQNRVPEFARELVFLSLNLEELRKHFIGGWGVVVWLIVVITRAVGVPRYIFKGCLLMPLRGRVSAIIKLIWLILFLDCLLRGFFVLWVGLRFR